MIPNDISISMKSSISTVLTSFIVDNLSIRSVPYGILFTMVSEIVRVAMDINVNDLFEKIINVFTLCNIANIFSYLWYLLYLVPVVISAGIFYFVKYYEYCTKFIDNRRSLQIHDTDTIIIFGNYMNKYKEYFNLKCNISVGNNSIANALFDTRFNSTRVNTWLRELNSMQLPIDDSKIIINDKRFNFSGEVRWLNKNLDLKGSAEKGNTISEAIQFKYLEFKSLNKITDVTTYIESIKKYMQSDIHKNIYCYKVSTDANSERRYGDTIMFEANANIIANLNGYVLEDMEKKYMDSFFHPDKYNLWTTLKRIKTDPDSFLNYGQVPSKNLLLHGPPGTGKSTFAYRVAMTLGYNIVEIDLKEITKKKHMYSLFEAPYFQSNIFHGSVLAKNTVYILDEFDRTIEYLHRKEIQCTKKNTHDHLLYYDSDWGDYYDYSVRNYRRDNAKNTNDKIKNKENEEDENEDENDEENESKTKSKTKKKSKEKSKTSSKDDDDKYAYSGISVKDLLDLFQGAVPVEGRIIIATTNNYERMKEICPALFRPGRMTPVYFGNPTRDILMDITRYYYKRELNIDVPLLLDTPTSNIIDICMRSLSYNDPYGYYINELQKLI